MSFWKNLKSKVTGKTSGAAAEIGRARSPSAPQEKVEVAAHAANQSTNPFIHQSDNPLDLDSAHRTGKIARLPRPLRERINHALYRRCTAKKLVQALNQMPEVKAVLAEHFGGRAISTQNIYEWKWNGYRDWLRRRQILDQKRELAADAQDLADTAPDMADSLFGMLTLDYAHLLMHRATEDPEAFEKRRKVLSTLAQDVVRLRRSHLNARRVQIQETRLEREEEKTEEQLLLKFSEWVDNPAVRKACILAPLEADRRRRIIFDLPPAPEDPLVERETKDDPYFGTFDKNKTGSKPNKTENSHPDSPPSPKGTTENSRHHARVFQHRVDEPENISPEGTAEPSHDDPNIGPISPVLSHPEGALEPNSNLNTQNSTLNAPNPYAGKCTQDIIAEIEENYAREKAERLNRRERNETDTLSQREKAGVRENLSNENPDPQPKPKRELSPYDQALLEGKTHLEAMYAQATPVEKSKEKDSGFYPKSKLLEGIADPVDAPLPNQPQPSWNPCVMRPPPGYNSLG